VGTALCDAETKSNNQPGCPQACSRLNAFSWVLACVTERVYECMCLRSQEMDCFMSVYEDLFYKYVNSDTHTYTHTHTGTQTHASEWRRLASFLIAVFAHRESLIHPSA
jgi:hypothetical protein